MRIAVIGAGAMGSIYGGHLSMKNEVYLVDTNAAVVEHLQKEGLKLQENGADNLYYPKAVTSTEGIAPVDLVILFVKALFSKAALSGNKGIIGPDTYVMTLQNGSGHEDILGEFVPQDHIIIGTTNDNGAILGMGYIRHGGVGETNIGMLVEDDDITDTCSAFVSYLNGIGYAYVGIYASWNWLSKEGAHHISIDDLADYVPYWVAQYNNHDDLSDEYPDNNIRIWQFSDHMSDELPYDVDLYYEGD